MLSQHKKSWLQLAAIALLTGFMAACTSGGDIGSGGNQVANDDPDAPVDPDNPDAPPPATIASIDLVAASTVLRSDADMVSEGVTLTALVSDANSNLVAGVNVVFSVVTGSTGTLSVTRGTTDESGTAEAILFTPTDSRNRNITVQASASGRTDTLDIAVTGTSLAITGPVSIGSQDSGSFIASLTNAGGEGIGDEDLTISSAAGNTISVETLTTNPDGQVPFTIQGDVGGADTITVTGLGLQADQSVTVSTFAVDFNSPEGGSPFFLGETVAVEVAVLENGNAPATEQEVRFSTTRGDFTGPSTVTTVNGIATAEIVAQGPGTAGPAIISANGPEGSSESVQVTFIARNPSEIEVQASPSSLPINATSQIRAVVRDADNNLVQNQVVNFTLEQDPSAGQLSAGSATTNNQGLATVTYTAGDAPSGADAVVISASVDGTNVEESTTLTVGGQALRIAIGTGNDILVPDASMPIYELPYVAVVTDSGGNPAPANTIFRLRVESTRFATGFWAPADSDGDGEADILGQFFTSDNVQDDPDVIAVPFCDSEDVDLDGILDQGEDRNSSGELEPFAVASVPSTVDLNENGQAFFSVTYPQSHNTWTEVKLTATATVSGTESSNAVTFILPGLDEDFDDVDDSPPGEQSPYNATSGCAGEADNG